MNNSKLIKAENISKIFNDGDKNLVILKKINFELEQGEKVAILGASGSGKSTLLHILAGLDNPTTGSVKLNSSNINKLPEYARAKLRNMTLGFVYQFHHLLPEFTAVENVAMPLLIRGMDFDTSLDKAKQILSIVGLKARALHKPAKLSGGERQRVAIARALITKPICIMADEPTGNLDEYNAKNIFKLLLDLNSEANTSLLLVTHDRSLANQLDKVYTLNHGNLKLDN